MDRLIKTLFTVVFLLVATNTALAKDGFPGRRLFPDVKVMEMNELEKQFGKVIIVDARTRYEFDTIHISGAQHALVSKASFEGKIKDIRSRSKKPIVFYCNGHTCMKSYKATRRAMNAGIKNVYAFDAGIFDWSRANPDKAVLLGRSPIRVRDLIPKKVFKKRLLKPKDFVKRVDNSNVLVLDVRSRLQRAGSGLFAFSERHASLDDRAKLNRYINKAIREKKTLLAYDAVGKQVRWFEYYLRKKGLRNYYFMKGGEKAYFKYLGKTQKKSMLSSKGNNVATK